MDTNTSVALAGAIAGLTPDLLKRHFAVAPSLRRRNADLFEPWIAGEALRDDAAFYRGLAEMITAAPARIRDYDARMRRDRDDRKAFGHRALYLIWQGLGPGTSIKDARDLPPDRFPGGSEARTIHDLYLHLYAVAAGGIDGFAEGEAEDGNGPPEPGGAPAQAGLSGDGDWRVLAGRITALCQALIAPDAERAEEILEAARDLVDVCRQAAEDASLRAARRARAEQFLPRADALGLTMPTIEVVAALEDEAFGALQVSLGAAEEAAQVLAEYSAAERDLAAQKRVADAADDLDALIPLLQCLKAARSERQAAESAAEAALSACRAAMLAVGTAAEPASAPPSAVTAEPMLQPAAPPTITAEPRPEAASTEPDAQPSEVPTAMPVREAEPLAPAEPGGAAELKPQPLREPTGDAASPATAGVAVPEVISAASPPPAKAVVQPAPVLAPEEPEQDLPGLASAAANGQDGLLARYLEQGEAALAFHVAACDEAEGRMPGVPSALLKALVRTDRFERPDQVADSANQKLLAEAMDALATVEQQGNPLRISHARCVAFAALLRPALFDFNRTARSHLGRVAMVDELQGLAQLATALGGLGFDVQLSIEDLAEIHGRERQRKMPAALKHLREWREMNRRARTAHQPTSYILQGLLLADGDIGRVVDAVVRNDNDAAPLAQELLSRLSDLEAFVRDAEKASGRPRGDRIEGLALDWIRGRLGEGRERLAAWLAAVQVDNALDDDRRRGALRHHVGALMKACEAAGAVIALENERLTAALHAVLQQRLDDFQVLLRGQGTPRDRNLDLDPLREVLLRLPGQCLPYWEPGPGFEEERTAQARHLASALAAPHRIAADLRRAFPERLRECATAAAAEILATLESRGEDAVERLQQDLGETIRKAQEQARRRSQALQQDLATLLNLDLSSGEEVRRQLDRLDAIAAALASAPGAVAVPCVNGLRDPEVPPDFPHLGALLSEIEGFRDDLRERVRREQLGRLDRLAGDGDLGAAAGALRAQVQALDPVTVDDMIADLEAGREPLAADGAAADAFGGFFPGFVDELARATNVHLGQVIQAATQRGLAGPVDFRALDKTATERGKALVEAWAEAQEALRQARTDRLIAAVARLLGVIGLTGVRVDMDRVLDKGRLLGLRLSCDVPKAARWFLPPEFGSLAQGSYRLLVAAAAIDPKQVASAVGEAPDRPWVVFHFGRLDRKARETLARSMRQDRRAAVLLDEALLLHLAAAGGDPLERLFVCGTPFAWVQPYTTNPRNIPTEMFFGRREEMARITARSTGGCLIYGGRQLGKSAMLNQIRRSHHHSAQGQLALYLDIGEVGDEPVPTEAVWPRIAAALREEKGLQLRGAGAADVEAAIGVWLQGSPERRILLMLDEADHFLASEHPSYSNLRRMKNLMESTEWRFKVVFAGLHNVRRLAQAPNSPLVHLGEPICIGPMNTTTENQRELRRLVMQPMHAAGFAYDPPGLAADILARVNHYPSLVQVFCKEVVEATGGRFRPAGPGPRWMLGRDVLFEGGIAARIADEIRSRFQWTLDLDPRYDLVAKTLALYRLDHADGHAAVLRDGMAAERIHGLVQDWWPTGLARLSAGDFVELLNEMVDLGVLGLKAGSRYGLRNAQVAQMLGKRDPIEDEIIALAAKEPKADYDAATFHRRADPADPDSLSPLPDRELAQLFARAAGGVPVVVAASAIFGADTAGRLAALARQWEDTETGAPLDVLLHRGKPAELRAVLEARRAGLIVVLEGPWNQTTHEWLVQREEVRKGRVRPIWVLEPADLQLPRSSGAELRLFQCAPLGETMVRHWLRRLGFAKLDERNTVRAVLDASAGAPARLAQIRPMLAELVGDTPALRAERLVAWSRANSLPAEQLGLGQAAAATFREIVQIVDGPDQPDPKSERKTILELVPSAVAELDCFVERSLVEELSDGRMRLTRLGRLTAG